MSKEDSKKVLTSDVMLEIAQGLAVNHMTDMIKECKSPGICTIAAVLMVPSSVSASLGTCAPEEYDIMKEGLQQAVIGMCAELSTLLGFDVTFTHTK